MECVECRVWEVSPGEYNVYVSISSSRAEEIIRIAISPLEHISPVILRTSQSVNYLPICNEQPLDRS